MSLAPGYALFRRERKRRKAAEAYAARLQLLLAVSKARWVEAERERDRARDLVVALSQAEDWSADDRALMSEWGVEG